MSDLDEAIKDYESLYHDFENTPVADLQKFKALLEGFVMNGTKLLYFLSDRYRPRHLQDVAESLEPISRSLIKVRLADEDSLREMDLESLKTDLLNFFEKSFRDLEIIIRFHSPFYQGH